LVGVGRTGFRRQFRGLWIPFYGLPSLYSTVGNVNAPIFIIERLSFCWRGDEGLGGDEGLLVVAEAAAVDEGIRAIALHAHEAQVAAEVPRVGPADG